MFQPCFYIVMPDSLSVESGNVPSSILVFCLHNNHGLHLPRAARTMVSELIELGCFAGSVVVGAIKSKKQLRHDDMSRTPGPRKGSICA